MTILDMKIGQIWEWEYKNRFWPNSYYLVVGRKKLYDGSSVLPPRPDKYVYDLVELGESNTRIEVEIIAGNNCKLFIDIEPNR